MERRRTARQARWSVPVVACAAIAAMAFWSGRPAVALGSTKARSKAASLTTSDGQTRTYRIYVPCSLPRQQPVPLLVALHGGFGSGLQFENNSGFDALADAHDFIVVYPDGTPIQPRGTLANARVWNGGRCCGPAARQQVDDVEFIRQLIDAISHQHDIDPTRVYATGHSNGAIMSYRLACDLSDTIVAIGVQAGSLEVSSCQPANVVSMVHIHGSADQNIPISGGLGDGLAAVAFNPPRDAAVTFAKLNGCAIRALTCGFDGGGSFDRHRVRVIGQVEWYTSSMVDGGGPRLLTQACRGRAPGNVRARGGYPRPVGSS